MEATALFFYKDSAYEQKESLTIVFDDLKINLSYNLSCEGFSYYTITLNDKDKLPLSELMHAKSKELFILIKGLKLQDQRNASVTLSEQQLNKIIDFLSTIEPEHFYNEVELKCFTAIKSSLNRIKNREFSCEAEKMSTLTHKVKQLENTVFQLTQQVESLQKLVNAQLSDTNSSKEYAVGFYK
ncbi:hypothetical protein [Legionella shakespearei]|uniref:Uncharacterized protein n=1 Tax=Legionella shakespearei DSM 23087 TaxID=1122169 RepID=A0A0W0YNP5_9GAMM|nr:hypothetical protein [Legionella shakespearei]KTD58150.1 hypothetical protein Lsha_2128 [Legionella shakespearei DSM 23087]